MLSTIVYVCIKEFRKFLLVFLGIMNVGTHEFFIYTFNSVYMNIKEFRKYLLVFVGFLNVAMHEFLMYAFNSVYMHKRIQEMFAGFRWDSERRYA